MSHSSDHPGELEAQFILRLPEGPAEHLRDILKSGNPNLKERMKLKLEDNLRHGNVYLDNYVLPAKMVDLPCVMEAHKSIDKKVVYKTADLCQMLLCTTEEDPPEEEVPKGPKKSGNKVEKKYIWPHGITPPLKNVRKRRFRKILKKKQYLDQPEIEKEVRRLLRTDYEAHHVSWEVFDEEEDRSKEGSGKDVLMQGSKTNEPREGRSSTIVAELFGDALSDSDDERIDLDDESRSRISVSGESGEEDSFSLSQSQESPPKDRRSGYATSFSKDMFVSPTSSQSSRTSLSPEKHPKGSKQRRPSSSTAAAGTSEFSSLSRSDLQGQLNELKQQLTEISCRRQIQETELSTTDNAALKSRLETVLDKLINDQNEKEREIRQVEYMLSQF